MNQRKLLHRAGDHSLCRPEVCEHAPRPEPARRGPFDHPVTLNDLARRHYETGEYGNAHLALRRDDMDHLREHLSREKPPSFDPTVTGTLGNLTSIPVVIDDELAPLRWELRDNRSKRVITAGTLLGDLARSEPS